MDLGAFEFNPAEAKESLVETGTPGGLELQIADTTQPSWGLEVLRIVVEDWDETGFNLSIQTLPVSVFWRRWTVYPLRFMEWGTALSE